MIKFRILPEPKLFFGNNESTIDSKVGLMNFGPYGPSSSAPSPITITAGVISTNGSLDLLKAWLERLSYRIEGRDIPDSNVRSIDFPGISKESPLKFEIRIIDSAIEIISRRELSNALNSPSRKERIGNIFEIYKQKFLDMSGNHPRPDIILLPIDKDIMDKCKDKRFEGDKIIYERRTFDKSKMNTDVPLFDFHNAMKVIAFNYGMVSQLIRPKTLLFAENLQDPATIAWNFSVATYYKGTGTPWKLADIDEDTCFVGISFFHEIFENERIMNTSMAHIYLKTGESQIIRGKSFLWDDSKGLSPALASEHASYILEKVISLYKRQKRKEPRRIVVHKSSGFTEDEQQGFNDVTVNIEMVDYVHIARMTGVRAYPEGYSYPAIRGTMFGKKKKWFLFTTGFVPSLGTYPGATIPMPLIIQMDRVDSTPYQICRDIMALTKLDWNTADFCRREPVTLSVSRKVGNILSEMRNNGIKNPPEGYRYYM